MNIENLVFGSPVDEALFKSLTPLSVRTEVFPVVYGPEDAEVLYEVQRLASLFPILTEEGKRSVLNPEGYNGIFNPSDGVAFFRVAEGNEKRTVYFRTENGDTGLSIYPLNSEDEINAIETIAVNYYDRTENAEDDIFRTRVFFRTVGCNPREAYRTPRFFDLLFTGPDETLTEADFFERRKADVRIRIAEEADHLREEIKRAEALIRRAEALIRTVTTEEEGDDYETLTRYLAYLENTRFEDE